MTTSSNPLSSPKGTSHTAESELRAHLVTHWSDLYSRALRLARNETIAQDLLQDTFERALRFEKQYEPNSNLRAWLQRILLSVFMTRCRRLRRERRAVELLTNDPCAWTRLEGPAPSQTLSPAVDRALLTLPEAFRRAVELIDLGDMSYRNAADALGVPLGTVMSRLHRGRRMLAEALLPAEDRPADLPEAA